MLVFLIEENKENPKNKATLSFYVSNFDILVNLGTQKLKSFSTQKNTSRIIYFYSREFCRCGNKTLKLMLTTADEHEKYCYW